MGKVLCAIVVWICICPCYGRTYSENEFQSYLEQYGKVYSAGEDFDRRFETWRENMIAIDQHNTEAADGLHSYIRGVNQFTDMTPEEFRKTMLTKIEQRPSHNVVADFDPAVPLPASVDWRAQGYVTEVGNQGPCGSCWAFTATGALEGQHKKATGILVDLSEQNLMDCSQKQGNEGCNGGFMDASFTYVKENGGIDTEKSYPYNSTFPAVHQCKYKVSNRGATCTGFMDLSKGNETALQMAVALVGPVAVAVDATDVGFGMYKNGVYDNPKCSSLNVDHTLLVTGYGIENGKEFWECKNSWGTTWGNQGYIRMSRNKANQCGIATMASYPTV